MLPLDEYSIESLTAALAGMEDFVFLETSRPTAGNHRSMLFTDPLYRLVCSASGDTEQFLARAQRYLQEGYFLAGWFSYEFGRAPRDDLPTTSAEKSEIPLAWLGVFHEPFIYDHASGCFSGRGSWPTAEPDGDSCRIGEPQPNISRQDFFRDLAQIKEYILSGDTYQVNYTFQLDFSLRGSRAALYRQLRRNQSVGYGAWIRVGGLDVMSFSPELFFRADHSGCTVRPMKGTIVRGRTLDEDSVQANLLRRDPKCRGENVMIVDMLRNDLGRLAFDTGRGAVQVDFLFDVETYESLLQMTSTISATLDPPGLPDLHHMLHALFPCGSVTGAPKIRTMEIIEELERTPRGVYCGAVGFCSSGEMCFNVPIRTLTLSGDHGTMGIGAGIVHDSDPEAEWRECLLKGRFLTHSRPEFQLIETLCLHPDKGYLLLEEHCRRLADSAEYFFFHCDLVAVRSRLSAVQKAAGRQSLRVRLLLHKDGRLEVSSSPLSSAAGPAETSRVIFSSIRTDPDDVFLYHKTTLREVYNRERARAIRQGFFEVLFCNTLDEVTEGAISTIFVEKEGMLFTPPLSCGLLPGTFRHSLLASGRAREQVLGREDLRDAEKIYVANSVRGLQPVELVDEEI